MLTDISSDYELASNVNQTAFPKFWIIINELLGHQHPLRTHSIDPSHVKV